MASNCQIRVTAPGGQNQGPAGGASEHRGRRGRGPPDWQTPDPDWPLSAHYVNITDHFWTGFAHHDTPNPRSHPAERGIWPLGSNRPNIGQIRPKTGQKQAKTQGWAHRCSKVVKSVFEGHTLKMVQNHYLGDFGSFWPHPAKRAILGHFGPIWLKYGPKWPKTPIKRLYGSIGAQKAEKG